MKYFILEARLDSGEAVKVGGGIRNRAAARDRVKGKYTLIDKKGLRQLWRRYQKAIESGEPGAVKALQYWAWCKWHCERDTFYSWLRKIKQGKYNLRKTGGLYSKARRKVVWSWKEGKEA